LHPDITIRDIPVPDVRTGCVGDVVGAPGKGVAGGPWIGRQVRQLHGDDTAGIKALKIVQAKGKGSSIAHRSYACIGFNLGNVYKLSL
jgi:hypothetical protein